MTEISSYRDLIAWQMAYQLGLATYWATQDFAADERFTLTSQLRRSAISISSNIAEGYGRQSTSDYTRFLRVARGSLYELDTQLSFAVDLGYLARADYQTLQQNLNEAESSAA